MHSIPPLPPVSAALNRRDFAKVLTVGGAGACAWLATAGNSFAQSAPAASALPPPLPPAPAQPDERYWQLVRAQFAMPPDLTVLNAANLCPSPLPVVHALCENTRSIDRDPSFENRKAIGAGKETTRQLLASFLGATPEEIIITRNTSEGNNLVSLGLELRPGDEIILFSDNHPCNKAAWAARRERYGFTIIEVPVVGPHPGAEHYLAAVRAALTPRTRLLTFTHLTNTVGDLFPAKELCRFAHEHGVLTLVDGAQSFGLLEVDLRELSADFYTGSAHKWLCGPKEVGVLYVNARAQSKLWPSIVSSGNGAVGISRTHEAFGQRDEPAIIACGEAVKFQLHIGRKAIEARARALAQALMEGLRRIDGVKLYTHADPARSAAVVVFQPGDLNPAKLAATLYHNDRIACAPRSVDRPGLRLSPHFYNLPGEIDRTVAAIKRTMASGLG